MRKFVSSDSSNLPAAGAVHNWLAAAAAGFVLLLLRKLVSSDSSNLPVAGAVHNWLAAAAAAAGFVLLLLLMQESVEKLPLLKHFRSVKGEVLIFQPVSGITRLSKSVLSAWEE